MRKLISIVHAPLGALVAGPCASAFVSIAQGGGGAEVGIRMSPGAHELLVPESVHAVCLLELPKLRLRARLACPASDEASPCLCHMGWTAHGCLVAIAWACERHAIRPRLVVTVHSSYDGSVCRTMALDDAAAKMDSTLRMTFCGFQTCPKMPAALAAVAWRSPQFCHIVLLDLAVGSPSPWTQ